MKTCERCGEKPPKITTGPLAGHYGMLDFCLNCSKDLCETCMAKGCCGVKPAASGNESDS